MRVPERSYYDVLGVSRRATAEQIRVAYRKLAAQYHPDKHSGNPLEDLARERLAELNRAYSVLSDAALRAEYDTQFDFASEATAHPSSPGRRYEHRTALGSLRRWRNIIMLIVALLVLPRVIGPLARGVVSISRAAGAGLGSLASGSRLILVLAVVVLIAAALYARKRRSN